MEYAGRRKCARYTAISEEKQTGAGEESVCSGGKAGKKRTGTKVSHKKKKTLDPTPTAVSAVQHPKVIFIDAVRPKRTTVLLEKTLHKGKGE